MPARSELCVEGAMVVSVVAKYRLAFQQFGLRAMLTKMYTVSCFSILYVGSFVPVDEDGDVMMLVAVRHRGCLLAISPLMSV